MFLVLVKIALEGCCFLLPGVAFACFLASRYVLDKGQFVCVSLVASGAAGYLAFWLYLLSARAGRASSIAILLASLTLVVVMVHRFGLERFQFKEIATCALMMVLTTSLYTGLGFLYKRSENPATQAQLRFVHPLPIDNALPYFFADKLYHSDRVRPYLLADWKSSDRPPLQTGIALLQFPMWKFQTRGLDYQILGTLLQSMSIASIWILMNSISIDRRLAIVVLAFCIFSGFFLVYTFYVWPKLLAASYFLLALTALGFAEGNSRRVGRLNSGIAGAALGLAVLAHGGTVFSLIALAIVLLATRSLPRWQSLLLGSVMFAAFLLPWMIYQKFYDPPGDRLLKWHLAGITEVDSRSFLRLLDEAYTKPKTSVIIKNKIQNVKTLFGPFPSRVLAIGSNSPPWRTRIAWYKEVTFFYFFQTLGVLNVGFFALFPARVFPAKSGLRKLLPAVQRLLLLAVSSLIVWCLLMYLPGSTLIHQGSLADVAIFFVVLGMSLAVVAPRLTYVLLGMQMFLLFPAFALVDTLAGSQPNTLWGNAPDRDMAWLSILSLLGLVGLGWKMGFSSTQEKARVPCADASSAT